MKAGTARQQRRRSSSHLWPPRATLNGIARFAAQAVASEAVELLRASLQLR